MPIPAIPPAMPPAMSNNYVGGKHSHDFRPDSLGTPTPVTPTENASPNGNPACKGVSGASLPFDQGADTPASQPAKDLSKAVARLSTEQRPVKLLIAHLHETLAKLEPPVSLRLTYHWPAPKGDQEVNIDLTIGDDGTRLVSLKNEPETIPLQWDKTWGIKLPGYSTKSSSTDPADGPFVTVQRTSPGNTVARATQELTDDVEPEAVQASAKRRMSTPTLLSDPTGSSLKPTRVVVASVDDSDTDYDEPSILAKASSGTRDPDEAENLSFTPVHERESKYAALLDTKQTDRATGSREKTGRRNPEISASPPAKIPVKQTEGAGIRAALFKGNTVEQDARRISPALDQHAREVGDAASLLTLKVPSLLEYGQLD